MRAMSSICGTRFTRSLSAEERRTLTPATVATQARSKGASKRRDNQCELPHTRLIGRRGAARAEPPRRQRHTTLLDESFAHAPDMLEFIAVHPVALLQRRKFDEVCAQVSETDSHASPWRLYPRRMVSEFLSSLLGWFGAATDIAIIRRRESERKRRHERKRLEKRRARNFAKRLRRKQRRSRLRR